MFHTMLRQGAAPHIITCNALISACDRVKQPKWAEYADIKVEEGKGEVKAVAGDEGAAKARALRSKLIMTAREQPGAGRSLGQPGMGIRITCCLGLGLCWS